MAARKIKNSRIKTKTITGNKTINRNKKIALLLKQDKAIKKEIIKNHYLVVEKNMTMKNSNTIQPEVLFPYNLIRDMELIPAKHVTPCSLLINDQETGCLFISCLPKDLEFLGIHLMLLPEPLVQFRMKHNNRGSYIIEVKMEFANQRILKLFLNPNKSQVKKWLALGEHQRMLAFVLHEPKSCLLKVIMMPNYDASGWFAKSRKITSKLKTNNGYVELSKTLEDEASEGGILYHYHDAQRKQYFIIEGRTLVEISNSVTLNHSIYDYKSIK